MSETTRNVIAYYRVSTRKQGLSGLGLEGQQAAVADYASRNGTTVVYSYTEVESGKRKDRPELLKAIAHAKRNRATLVVAKLDRLARNVAFLSALMESGADFVACDNPHANRLTIHILAAVAEDEAKRISERTKAALQAAKARGTKLGSARPGHWVGREDKRLAGLVRARKAGVETIKESAQAAYADLLPMVKELYATGKTLQAIADTLNGQGHLTRRGKLWTPVQVMRVLRRACPPEKAG
jgi:DNA invertase Pin-like site-specific DNA recombinase